MTQSPLWRGPFRWFFAGRLVDLAGSSMTPAVLALSVLEQTRSATHVGVVMAANVTPTLLLMLLGGVLADRWPRARILLVTCAASATVQALMAALLISSRFSLGTMALLAALSGAIGGFNSPALRGIVPELVDPAHIQQANAALATARNAVRIAGPALGGVLVAGIGGGWALAADALSFVLAGLFFLRLPVSGRAHASAPLLGELVAGWSAFRALRWVWTLSLAYAVINLLLVGPWQVLGAVVVEENHGAAAWGTVLSVRAVGLLAASSLMLRLRLRSPVTTGLLVGTASGLPLLTLAWADSLWPLMVAVMLGAVGSAVSGITYESALHSRVPREVLSRVSSYDDLLSFVMVPISQALAGPVSGLVRAQPLLLVCGIGIVLTHLAPLASSAVRQASRASGSSSPQP